MPELLIPEDVEIERQVAEISPSALAILNQSEHAAMVQTANLANNRRKITKFDSEMMELANHSQAVATMMFYSLPRGGKQVIGPSSRFAEIVPICWRNCAVGARVMGDAATTVTAQGVFIDYETNVRNAIEVPRRITDKDGKRFNDDLIVLTMNATMSIARRNAVLKGGVPQALWTPAYLEAQLTAVGKATSHANRVAEAMNYLQKLGITEWQILNAVGVPSPKDLETEHLVTLRVLCAELKRGDKTVEEVFGSQHDKEIDSLFGQLGMNLTQQRMLRQSYMGRAEQLVEYLRSRLGPARTAPETKRVESKPAEVKTAEPAPVEEKSAEDKPETKPVDQEWPQQDVEPAPANPTEPSDPGLNPFSEAQTQQTEAFNFGDNPQKEPAPRRRGRPTREEQARRAAQIPEQGSEEQGDDAFSF